MSESSSLPALDVIRASSALDVEQPHTAKSKSRMHRCMALLVGLVGQHDVVPSFAIGLAPEAWGQAVIKAA
jgi:hypothetical protein